jgi:uncharacterized membrane protein
MAATNRLRGFFVDTRGNIAITSAVVMTVIIGMGALGVDVGKMFTDRRKAQSTTDIAALVAASNLSNATAAATAAVTQNNFNATAPIGVQLGVYTADPSLAPSQRFSASSSPGANAVRVTLQTSTPLFFGRLLVGGDTYTIKTVATATATPFASFEIGSTLVSLNGGLLNAILGQMLGTSLSLSAMDYQSLLSANVDMFSFMNALATRLNLTGVTYSTLLSGNAQVGTVIKAMIDSEQVQTGTGAAVSALSQIANALPTSTTRIPLNSLLNAGPYGTMAVGQTPNSTVSMSAFNVLDAAASLANGTNQVAASLNLNLPGITTITLQLAIGQRPVGTSWVTVGSAGASVYTAQTRLLLTAQVQGTGGLTSITVPIYVNVASGQATLNSVQCGYPNINTSSVTLGVTPGVVDSWIGNVSASDFANLSRPPNPGPATLVSAPGVSVSGLAHVAMNNMTPTPVSFSYSQIQAQTGQTVSTTNYTSSLVTQLLQNLTLNASVLGLGLGLPPGVTQSIGDTLAAETSSLDLALATVLATVGVGIGQATVWVTGVRCDGAVLVN